MPNTPKVEALVEKYQLADRRIQKFCLVLRKGMALIIRTAGSKEQKLVKRFPNLISIWENIKDKTLNLMLQT